MPSPHEEELRRRLDAAGPEDFARLDAVYDVLSEQDATGREFFLEALERIDRELHLRASKMFDVDTRALAYFDSPPTLGASEAAQFARLPAILEAGTRLGSYEIVRLIARGGMGVVYEARQSSPRRRVALKLLRPEIVTESLLRRFDLESEILGRLDHPAIAKIHESGVEVRDGVPIPFHAMELIEGVSLTRYIHDRDVTRRRLLELFLEACDGVAHAHRKAVIHRDLKPSNILVDRDGAVKLIDFGIARVVDEEGLEETLDGQVVGTVSHMSPEQARGSRGQVDTRTDVYALGVILHQLLVGRPPLDLAEVPLPAAMRIIAEEIPTRLGEIDSTCRGDLETIVAKALEKRREDRYPSVEALREDVRRHIDHEAIAARPTGVIGRFTKWIRREPILAALLAVLIVSLPTIALLAVQYFESRDAVERTEQADRRRLIEELLTSAYLEFGEGDAEVAVEKFREALAVDPSVREAIGGLILSQIQLGQPDEAALVLEEYRGELAGTSVERILELRLANDVTDPFEAKELEKTLPPPTTPLEHYLRGQVALIEVHGGDRSASVRAMRHMLQAALLTKTPRELYYHHFAHAAAHTGNEDLARMAVEILEKLWPDSPGSRFWAGFTEQSLGNLEEAEKQFSLSAVHCDLDSSIGVYQRFRALHGQCTVLNELGQYERVLSLAEEMVRLRGEETVESLTQRGNALRRLGKPHEAVVPYREAVVLRRTELTLCNLAGALSSVGKLAEAEELFEQAYSFGPSSADLDFEFGNHCLNNGRMPEAAEVLTDCVRKAPGNAKAWGNLCMVLRNGGDLAGSIKAGLRAVTLDPSSTNSHINLGVAYIAIRDIDSAAKHFELAAKLRPDMYQAVDNLGFVRQDQGRIEEAIVALGRGVELETDNWRAAYNLGDLLLLRGRCAEAADAFRYARELVDSAGTRANIDDRLSKCADFARRRGIVADLEEGEEPPGSPLEVAALAMVAAVDGRAAEAYEWITEALDEDDRVEEVHFASVVRVASLAAQETGDEDIAEDAAELLAEEILAIETGWRNGMIRDFVARRRLHIRMRDRDYEAARDADPDLAKKIEELLRAGV